LLQLCFLASLALSLAIGAFATVLYLLLLFVFRSPSEKRTTLNQKYHAAAGKNHVVKGVNQKEGNTMHPVRALGSGLAGACAVTLVNEVARRTIPHAPRLEVLGMRGLAALLRGAEQPVPDRDTLFDLTLAGDLLSNALYYSLVGLGQPRGAWVRGGLLGLAAGLGGAFLPPKIGLGHQPDERAPATQLMTIAWYLIGGLVAGAAAGLLAGGEEAWSGAGQPEIARGSGEGI
jgi:hypothetical protein